jgi:hypothetical protein
MAGNDLMKKAVEVKQRFENKWLSIQGVNAIGIGMIGDQIAIIISVDSPAENIQAEIPAQVEGVPIRIKITGKLKAL